MNPTGPQFKLPTKPRAEQHQGLNVALQGLNVILHRLNVTKTAFLKGKTLAGVIL